VPSCLRGSIKGLLYTILPDDFAGNNEEVQRVLMAKIFPWQAEVTSVEECMKG